MNLHGAANFVCTKVRVANHSNVWLLVEELNCIGRKTCNVDKYVLVRMAVDECIREEEHALLGVEDMHCGECIEFGTYTDNLLCHLDGV